MSRAASKLRQGRFGRRILAAALLCLAQSATDASGAFAMPTGVDADTLDQLMQLLAQRRHGEADFSEIRYLSVLSEPLRSSGTLIYEAPDHLEQRILQPRPQAVVLDHGVLTMRRGNRERSVSLAQQPQIAPLVDSIRALLAGERATLEQHFTLQLSGSLDRWQLRLEPRAAPLRSSVREIDMSGERDAIRQVQLQARNGDRALMQIQPHP
jgi:Outer membrane lipoprotein carrier protein LolA-like